MSTHVDSTLRDGVRHLVLGGDGPNTLDARVVTTLREALLDAAGRDEPVLLGTSTRFFCNGLDLGWALACDRDTLRAFFLATGALVLDLLELPVPVACAMSGHAIGAGKSIVLACDVRVGATGRCLFGAPEVNLGVPNPVFADRLLRALSSDRVANDLLCTGRLASAEEAVSLGLLDAAVEPDAVAARALERLATLAAVPRGAWAASKRQRARDLAAAVRAQIASHTDEVLLAHWFGEPAQRLLREAAARAAARRG